MKFPQVRYWGLHITLLMTQTTTDKETITKAREMTIDCWTGREESHHTQNIYLKVFSLLFRFC